MYNQRVERSAGYAGLAFIVILIVAVVIPGAPPTGEDSPATIGAYMASHRTAWLLSNWLQFPGAVFFLWFAVQLRAYLRLAPQVDDGLATYALAGAIATVAIQVVWASLACTLAFHPAAALGDNVIRMLYDFYNLLGALFIVPLIATVFAASHSGRRHASLPTGLVGWGYLTALLMAITTLSIFFTSGFLALGGIGSLLLAIVPFIVWVIWVSIVLIRAPRGAAEAIVIAEVDVAGGRI